MSGAGPRTRRRRMPDPIAAKPAPPEPTGGCPCLYTTPCHERCTCINPLSSSGCGRCCSYGSLEQRTTKAKYLAGTDSTMRSHLRALVNYVVRNKGYMSPGDMEILRQARKALGDDVP